MTLEKWDTCESSFSSQTIYNNPFTEVDLSVIFTHENGRTIQVNGFYDGDQTWCIRFMPLEEGAWTFETASNDADLDGQARKLTCVPPTKDYLRGPVHAKGHHFFRADGTPHYLLSKRLSCHWAAPDMWMDAIRYLKEHRITRVFFIMGGVHGTVEQLYGEGRDFDRYSLEKFQAIDRFIDALRQEDVLAGPYFYYFNDGTQREMTPEQDRAFIKYGMARFGAYCNVLPCFSNEVEQKFTTRKGEYDLRSHAWCNDMGGYMKELAVFGQACTVHNPMETDIATNPGFYTLLYDWPFPRTDYMMRQSQLAALSTVPEIRDDIPDSKTPAYNFKRATADDEWEQYNLIIQPDGTGEERYLFLSKRPGHVQTAHHDETLLVGDGAYPEGEEEQYGRSFMSLMRHTDDYRVVFKPLCKHDTSWTTQQSHPHPFFAPDDQSLFFNSDRGGRANNLSGFGFGCFS